MGSTISKKQVEKFFKDVDRRKKIILEAIKPAEPSDQISEENLRAVMRPLLFWDFKRYLKENGSLKGS